MIPRSLFRAAASLLPLLLAACATVTPSPERPRLVVLFVVDGLPQRQVTGYRPQLAPDGLARFLDRGAWYANANYTHAFTVTAAGHATLLTGATPSRTGIVGNEWRDPATGVEVYNTGDTAYRYIGNATQRLDGTSPRNLKADTVGDVLRRADPRAKVIGISGKDRGAILPAGHLGTAYMYMAQSGQFASSTYYMERHPAWVDAFNAARPADRWFKEQWRPLLPEAAYAGSLPDDSPWYGPRGGRLPMTMGAAADSAPNAAYYGSLLRSPFADQLALEFARAAIRGEQLGQDEVPDILVVSLSGHDYVNHAYSAESRLSHDHLLQLDRLLQGFFQDLDTLVGRDRYLAVLSADHGFTPLPEYTKSQGRDAGRVNLREMSARVNAELERSFGATPLVQVSPSSSLVVDRRLAAQRGLDLDRVAEVAREALLREPTIAAAYTRRELERGSLPDAPYFAAARRTWHPDVSGDVQYVLKQGWIATSNAATHGSPYPDDTHVPLLLWGPHWVRAGRVDTPVAPVDLAPTLARVLGLPPPPSSEGKPLP
ncbi:MULTISPECIES: alkaline phosphatase family protein [Ramlibacter]|uniref:Sulfatase-like hydrolase/transferase n=1 Tax=Ramlibacter pinisoli TaxID=2682844 RepID=A0A6N8IWQ5_9BURK|nr:MULTISPECIES: alkaline phosphatase family protein [Ramlibacter]MBA2961465.1 alkaline phosphatase family protein [Ramlibacter sp. CGMCC 1.13660]MVQ31409.1 sulfatase-like hydrolase/transferase [Ramlibacter pinisoli]